MPAVVRAVLDTHTGHPCPSIPAYHKASLYTSGSSNVYTNSQQTIRIGDGLDCGDAAAAGSPNVYVNDIAVHRQGDGTTGHGCFVPSNAESGSNNVFAN